MIRTMVAITALLVLLTGCAGGGDEGVADQTPATDGGAAAPDDGTGQSPDAEPGDDAEAAGTVLAQGFRFEPESLTVAAGSTVTWTNEDDIEHTATSGTPDAPTGDFDVALDGAGATGTHTFDAPGTYAYFCEVHNSMRGEIVVT